MLQFEGRFISLPTLFADDGVSLSEIRLARLIRWYCNRGVEGFYVCGEIGEFTALALAERKTVLETVIREARGVVPVIVNVTSMSTAASMDLAQNAANHGAKAVVVSPPYHGILTQEEIVNQLKSVGSFSKIPSIIVDPAKKVLETSKLELADIRSSVFADSSIAIDEFRAGGVSVARVDALGKTEITVAETAELFRSIHPAKVVKACLDLQNLDIGPPRLPLRRMQGEALEHLKMRLEPSSTRLAS